MRAFDVQLNGYGGVDFNSDQVTAESLHRVCVGLRGEGTEQFLATIITDSIEAMCRRTERLVRLRAADPLARESIYGIHLEGPFLSPLPGYIGAHPAEHARPASIDSAGRLLDAGQGLVRLMTLAPEMDPQGRLTRWLVDRGVRVAAGHTDASLPQLHSAIDAGLALFTHLGNGCPAVLPRHDNIIQRVLSLRERLFISWIADGHHIPPFALANYLRSAGLERSFVVSDAMAAAGLGPGRYQLGSVLAEVDAQGAAWSTDHSHLVGSASTLRRAADVLREHVGLDEQQVRWLTEIQPRHVLGLSEPESSG
jgi:N-acetylglucosamine-6-phosphate deacetylase